MAKRVKARKNRWKDFTWFDRDGKIGGLRTIGATLQDIGASLEGRTPIALSSLIEEQNKEAERALREYITKRTLGQRDISNQISLLKAGYKPVTPAQKAAQDFLAQSIGGWGKPYQQPFVNIGGQQYVPPPPKQPDINDQIKMYLMQQYLAGDRRPQILKGLGMYVQPTEDKTKLSLTRRLQSLQEQAAEKGAYLNINPNLPLSKQWEVARKLYSNWIATQAQKSEKQPIVDITGKVIGYRPKGAVFAPKKPNVLEKVRQKVMKGEPLTAGEQKIWDELLKRAMSDEDIMKLFNIQPQKQPVRSSGKEWWR